MIETDMREAVNVNDFDVVNTEITTQQMDEALKKFWQTKQEYDDAKAISNAKHKAMEEEKYILMEMLKATKKTKYQVDGYGTATLKEKLKVRTPKDVADKEALFAWLKEQHGGVGATALMSVKSQTLNKIFNDAFDEAKENGTADTFEIPGLGKGEVDYTLSFRAK
jgi:hypothetical protein